jgi:hypothetical protein
MLITFPSDSFLHIIIIGNEFFFHSRRVSHIGGRDDEVCVGFRRPAFTVVLKFKMS